jgi:ribokinase
MVKDAAGDIDFRVVVLGSANTDLVMRMPRLPAPGETVLGGEFYQAAGGKGANQAVAAARVARSPVTFITAVGDDMLGREMLERLQSENLDCRNIKVLPQTASGVALILVDRNGQNLIGVAAGANGMLSPADIESLPEDLFSQGGVFLASLEVPIDTVLCGLRRARLAGMTTIVNPAPAPVAGLSDEFLSLVDVLTPNGAEAAQIARLPPVRTARKAPPHPAPRANDPRADESLADEKMTAENAADDPSRGREAALQLLHRGVKAVIVTLGSTGCLIVEESAAFVEAHGVGAIDATAAGDCFSGVLAVSLAEGLPLIGAAVRANAAAAISVTRRGAQPSLPTRNEVDEFLERN